MTYVQSGIYFTSDGDSGEKVKSRGIDVTQLHHADVLAFMRGEIEELLVSTRQFVGLTNPAEWNYGQWQDSTKQVKIAGAKRVHMPARCAACALEQPMDKFMHDLTANPLYGGVESIKHPLPWLDNETLADPEMVKIETMAIADYETSLRHITTTPGHKTHSMDGDPADVPF